MKSKERSQKLLIVFTIILTILVVVAGGIIVYLLNNPVKEKVTIQNPTNVENNTQLETNTLNSITKFALEDYISKFYYVKNFEEITEENIDSLMCVAILDEPSKSLSYNGEKLELAKQNILKELVAEKINCSANSLPNSEIFIEGSSLSDTEYITQWPFLPGDTEQFVGYITEVTDVTDIGNNKFEITVLQVSYNLTSSTLDEKANLKICLSADQSEKNIVSQIDKNDINSYKSNSGEKCVKLVKEFAERNSIGYRTFTLELLENNNNSYEGNFKLISIK